MRRAATQRTPNVDVRIDHGRGGEYRAEFWNFWNAGHTKTGYSTKTNVY
jgi:hypothetical protein